MALSGARSRGTRHPEHRPDRAVSGRRFTYSLASDLHRQRGRAFVDRLQRPDPGAASVMPAADVESPSRDPSSSERLKARLAAHRAVAGNIAPGRQDKFLRRSDGCASHGNLYHLNAEESRNRTTTVEDILRPHAIESHQRSRRPAPGARTRGRAAGRQPAPARSTPGLLERAHGPALEGGARWTVLLHELDPGTRPTEPRCPDRRHRHCPGACPAAIRQLATQKDET